MPPAVRGIMVQTAQRSTFPSARFAMKRLVLALLLVSLLANLALGVWVVRARRQAVAATAAAAQANARVHGLELASAKPLEPMRVPRADTWKNLASDDLRILAGNLRAAGFPDAMVRSSVGSLLQERYAAKRRALIGDDQPQPFWKPRRGGLDPDKQAALRALAREQQDLYKDLFGANPMTAESRTALKRLYGNLPDDKLALVQRVQSDYADLQEQIRSESGGVLLPEDRQNLALLDEEKRKDLAALLSPAERQEYELNASPTAEALRARLEAFAPSEQEFRGIFALQQAFDERFNSPAANYADDAVVQARRTAEQQLGEQIRNLLGPSRYDEYVRDLDPGYRVAGRLASRYGLAADTALSVYNLQQDIQRQALAVRGDPQAMAGLAARANAALNTLLGAEAAPAYRQAAGAWLRAIERSALPAK